MNRQRQGIRRGITQDAHILRHTLRIGQHTPPITDMRTGLQKQQPFLPEIGTAQTEKVHGHCVPDDQGVRLLGCFRQDGVIDFGQPFGGVVLGRNGIALHEKIRAGSDTIPYEKVCQGQESRRCAVVQGTIAVAEGADTTTIVVLPRADVMTPHGEKGGEKQDGTKDTGNHPSLAPHPAGTFALNVHAVRVGARCKACPMFIGVR